VAEKSQEQNVELQERIQRGYRDFLNGEYERSKQLFEEAVAFEPRSAKAHAWLAAAYGRLIEKAWNLMDKIGLLSKLESEISTALELDSSLPLARRMNGARLLNTPPMLGGDAEAAALEFQYCIAQGMDEAEVWVLLAECYQKTEETAKAIGALQEAITREPLHERGNRLLQQLQVDCI
jgi:Tfp pilus assembly protein PilF